MHLERVLDRHQHLRADRRSAAVPKERRLPREIEKRQRVARAALAFRARADGPRIAECERRIVARGARLRVVDREPRIVKEPLAERDAVGAWKIVGGPVRLRKVRRDFHVEAAGQRDGAALDGWSQVGLDAGERERADGVVREPRREIVVGARMRRGGLADVDAILRGEDFFRIEDERDERISAEVEIGWDFDRAATRLAREMVRITAELAVALPPAALDREEDVPAAPAPVQAIHIGMERMARRAFRGIAFVRRRVEAEVEADCRIAAGRNVAERKFRPLLRRVDEGEPIVRSQPRTIGALQARRRQQVREPRDRQLIARAISQRDLADRQRPAIPAMLDAHRQPRGLRGRERKREDERGAEWLQLHWLCALRAKSFFHSSSLSRAAIGAGPLPLSGPEVCRPLESCSPLAGCDPCECECLPPRS